MNNINKNYFITFGVSLLVMIAIAVIVFMLMLPKQSAITKGVVQDYQNLNILSKQLRQYQVNL